MGEMLSSGRLPTALETFRQKRGRKLVVGRICRANTLIFEASEAIALKILKYPPWRLPADQLCWLVVRGAKGHFPETMHRELLAQVVSSMPEGASVTFLGDGEFDGTALQAELRRLNWHYVCPSASNIVVTACGVQFHIGDLGPPRGEMLAVTPAWMTAEQYGPISLLAIWEQAYKEPIYLVSNMADLDMAVRLYKKRPHIETFFSDLKSRGFQIDKSHLSDPKRLSRLLVACCLAYVWLVYLGVCALQKDWMKRLHRTDRCDLSLFRLGLRLLAHCLKEHIPIVVEFSGRRRLVCEPRDDLNDEGSCKQYSSYAKRIADLFPIASLAAFGAAARQVRRGFLGEAQRAPRCPDQPCSCSSLRHFKTSFRMPNFLPLLHRLCYHWRGVERAGDHR